jgi:succinate dehydrogenase/fumarate reductase cytochrome b subunit
MPVRSPTYYLVKLARISGWLLFLLVLLYILTGFSLCGEYGFEKLVSARSALKIHKLFEWPLLAVFGVHSCITIYFAMRRWGWIKRRTRT